MKEIKTKPKGGRPKLLESAAKAPKTAMKDVWLKSKERAVSELKETPFASQQGETSNAPANSAGDQMLSGMESTVRKDADLTYRGGKKLPRPLPGSCGKSGRFPVFFKKPKALLIRRERPHRLRLKMLL